jgi:hypothetical protein
MKEPLSPLTSSEAPAPGVARDPVRLLAGGGSAFEQGLLESVAGDRMSEASEQRLAQLFELPQAQPIEAGRSSTAAEAVPGTATRAGQLATRAGWGALGLVAAFLTSREPPAPSAERAAAALAATVAPMAAAPTTAAPALAGWVDPAPALAAPVSPEPATEAGLQTATTSHAVSRATAPKPRRAARSTPEPTPKPPPAATADGSPHDLRAELRLLESAKAALREGRANAAADTLSDHARRFPAGELAVEAELLRIDLALVRGERSRASATARRLLALPSAAQYRERLEALLRNDEAHAADDAVGVNRAGTDMTKRRSFK